MLAGNDLLSYHEAFALLALRAIAESWYYSDVSASVRELTFLPHSFFSLLCFVVLAS